MSAMHGKQYALTAGLVALLSVYFVHYQITFMGLDWYETVQWGRTLQVINGESGTPWQYRLFTEGMVYGLVRLFEQIGVARPIGTAFILFRIAQCFLTFSLAVAYYRKLGLTLIEGLLGVSLLVWGMCHGLYDTDMTFNTYTDMSLFLIAGLLILYEKPLWIIPLMVIAPFNRETSGCIPMMLLFSSVALSPKFTLPPRRILTIVGVSLLLWLAIVGGLRLVYGVRDYIVPTAGKEPILPLLMFNLTWWRTWVFLFATLGLLPIMALASWKGWPVTLQRFFWAVVPVWFPAHFALAHAPETRLFLVPQVLIFIPGALMGLRYFQETKAEVMTTEVTEARREKRV
jgi:hypothetical protein